MTKRLTITLVALSLLVMLAFLPASAVTGKGIQDTATVFIGEQGLCLAAPITGNTIAWYKDSTAVPVTLDVTSNKLAFSVDQATFADKLGNWYDCAGGTYTVCSGAAGSNYFTVADPLIDVKVWDWTQNKDVTGKSVPTGERLTIALVTNGYSIATPNMRSDLIPIPDWEAATGGASYYGISPTNSLNDGIKTTQGFIDIRVKTDQGNILDALRNGSVTDSASKAIPLTGMFVNTQPWFWGNTTAGDSPTYKLYWDTGALDQIGQSVYPAGTYTVYAEFNINQMKDFYTNAGAYYSGKTISELRTVTIVSDTVKITPNKDTVTRSKPFSVTVTGKPATFYWVWVKGTSQMSGLYDDQPPMIAPNQVGVYNASPSNGTTVLGDNPMLWGKFIPENKEPEYVFQQVPYSSNFAKNFNGTKYWAMIKTNENGVRTIEFTTSNQTKAQKYTIRVENNTKGPYTAAYIADPTTTAAKDYKTDECDVKVEKGTVTITAAGDGSYYLGEEIKFSGTNTETVKTYLFISGPNLKSVGSQFSTDPRLNAVETGDATTFKVVDVNADNTWSWKWGTATVALDAGTYTVYAVSAPQQKDELTDVAYGTVSIIVKKPFVSATVSQSTVARGDKIFVRGTAEGQPSKGVAMWILGKNKAFHDTASVSSDASFEFEIKEGETWDWASGQYFVVVQHPMQNDQFDIYIKDTNYVYNLRLGYDATTNPFGTKIFNLLGAGSLQGSDAAEALAQAINDPNVDDTYTKLQFLVEEPVIRIDAVGDRHVGDKFTITAQTNLAVDDEVLFEVYSSSFKPTQKSQSGEFSGATGTAKVTKGDSGMNKLTFDVDASTFKPDEYIVKANWILHEVTGTALFNVLEGAAPTAAPTAVVTTAAPVVTTAPPVETTVAPAKTPTQPGFGALVALIGLGAVAFLVVRKH